MNPEKIVTPAFDPNNPAYRGKLWVKRPGRHGAFRYFFWRRILTVLGILAVVGWLGITGAVWANLKLRRGFGEVRYVDLAVPWRWPRYLDAMSAHYVAMGSTALAHGSPDSAFYFYNAALAMRPANAEAKRLAALAQFRMGLRPTALSSLIAGIPAAAAAKDEAYLRQFFGMAFETQADAEAYQVGMSLLPARPDQDRIHLLVVFQVATAQYNRGAYAEAEKLLRDWNMLGFPDGAVLNAQCLWESGQTDRALQSLQDSLARFPQRHDPIYAVLEQMARAQKRSEDVLNYAILRQLSDPEHAGPQLDVLYADHALGRIQEQNRAVDAYCKSFKTDVAALGQLIQFAVDTGQPKIAERAASLAGPGGQPPLAFELAVAEAGLVGRDYAAVTRALSRIKADKTPTGRTFAASVAGVEALSKFGTGDSSAELAFGNFLNTAASLRPSEVLLFARCLRDNGQPQLSQQLLEKVYLSNSDLEPALIELARGDLAAQDRVKLREHLTPLLKMRKVPRDVLSGALTLLDQKTDEAQRAQIGALLQWSPAMPLSAKR